MSGLLHFVHLSEEMRSIVFYQEFVLLIGSTIEVLCQENWPVGVVGHAEEGLVFFESSSGIVVLGKRF